MAKQEQSGKGKQKGPVQQQQQQQQQQSQSQSQQEKKQSAQAEQLKSEEILQALLLGDSFDSRFAPITLDKPRTLLPIVNIPLLNYTIEFLASGGVQEIFIFCTAHAQQIKDYLANSRWVNIPSLKVKTIVGQNCVSAGDALREVASLNLINSDFVLVSGDLVSNMDLRAVLTAHKSRRDKDKNAIMTMVFKQAAPSHRTRSPEDDTVVALDGNTGQILYFDNSTKTKSVKLSTSLFAEQIMKAGSSASNAQNNNNNNNNNSSVEPIVGVVSGGIQIRYDLIDCHIDICAPEVLLRFTDEFDYMDIRGDFIKGTLSSEILGHKIHSHIISGEYAARVKDLRTYNSISRDIIHRWTYPLVPDTNFLHRDDGPSYTYTYSRQMRYIERGVKLSRSSKINEETVIGSGTQIGDNSTITHSVIGRNCRIGNSVTIKGSYLWEGVIVEDGASIINCIICDNAKVSRGVFLPQGCIISFGVVIGEGHQISPFARITNSEESADEEEDKVYTEDINLGKGGVGKEWVLQTELNNTLVPKPGSIDELSYYESDGSGDEVELKPSSIKKSGSDASMDNEGEQEDDEEIKWLQEIKDTLVRGMKENHSLDNLVLEINGLKFAYDRTFVDCINGILPALLDTIKDSPANLFLSNVQNLLKKQGALLRKFLNSLDDQVDLIITLQEYCEEESHKIFFSNFQNLLHKLYENEILEEDAILQWADEQENAEDKTLLKQSSKLITWLKEADEDDEGDEDDG